MNGKGIRKGLVFGIVFVLVFVVFAGIPMNVSAEDSLVLVFTEHQITSSDTHEDFPRLGNDGISDIVVYNSYELDPDGSHEESDIYYQRLVNGVTLGNPVLISSSSTEDYFPDIYGDYIVYVAYEPLFGYNPSIILYEISTDNSQVIRSSSSPIYRTRIHNNYVAWHEGASEQQKVMLYDLNWLGTPNEPVLLGGPDPRTNSLEIGERFVVWSEWDGNNYDLCAYDLNTNTHQYIANTETIVDQMPATYGSWIVWVMWDSTENKWSIEAKNMDTNEVIVVTTSMRPNSPAIYGDKIIYIGVVKRDYNFYNESNVYIYNLTTYTSHKITQTYRHMNAIFEEDISIEEQGIIERSFTNPIDVSDCNNIYFRVRTGHLDEIDKIDVLLRKYPEGTYSRASINVDAINGFKGYCWNQVILPKSSFDDTSWGLVDQIKFIIDENEANIGKVAGLHFDDIGFSPMGIIEDFEDYSSDLDLQSKWIGSLDTSFIALHFTSQISCDVLKDTVTYVDTGRFNNYDIYAVSLTYTNPPVADAGDDIIAFKGYTVQFDGSASYDPDGTIVTYNWDFDVNVDSDNDGDPGNDVDGTGPTPTHIYEESGAYVVNLTVIDDLGVWARDYITVKVHDMTLTKTANKEVAYPGDLITYTIVYENKGPCVVDYIEIHDTIPTEATYYSSTPFSSMSGSVYTWCVSNMNPGINIITLTVRVKLDTPGNSVIHNSVELWILDDSSTPIEPKLIDTVDVLIFVEAEINWIDQFGTTETDEGYLVSAHSTGIYVVGDTRGSLPGQTNPNEGFSDGFIRKYNSDGSVAWTDQFGLDSHDYAHGLCVDSSGLYITGTTVGSLSGEPSLGYSDAYIRKYDYDGNHQWTKQFGTAGLDSGVEISVDSSGIYVVGYTSGSFSGFTNEGLHDIFTSKFDLNGNHIWTDQFGSIEEDWSHAIALDSTSVYIVGRAKGALPGQTHQGDYDIFIRKYAKAGAIDWTKQIGTPGDDRAYDVLTNPNKFYITGYTTGSLFGDNLGGEDAFICEYDLDGNAIWTEQFGTVMDERAHEFDIYSNNLHIAGRTGGSLGRYPNAGGLDVFIRSYDLVGVDTWTYQFGTSAEDVALGISVNSSGIHISGYTEGEFPENTNLGGFDAFLAKIEPINTIPGPNVEIDLSQQLKVIFSEINDFGFTSFEESTENPGDEPSGFDFLGTYYDITTTASYPDECEITICIGYNDVDNNGYLDGTDPPVDENTLELKHWEKIDDNLWGWVDVKDEGYPDTDNNIICGTVTSLSWFGIAYPSNEPPIVTITGPSSGSINPVGTQVTFTGTFTDENPEDMHTAQWTFKSGDSTITLEGTVNEMDGTVTGLHTFSEPGVYSVTLTVSDEELSDIATTVDDLPAMVVIYDPTGGFVTGGGWIYSPAGAYKKDLDAEGKASFGFVSKYKKGATKPTGNTEFRFKAGNLNFHSDNYEWLVVAGARAQFKGTGTINGADEYNFMLTGIDGDINGGDGTDKFRIKIWTEDENDNEVIIYDNDINDNDTEDLTELGGGNIVIHTSKK